MSVTKISPNEVLKYTEYTKGYLCKLSANVYGIDFIQFKIRDMDTGNVIFHVKSDPDQAMPLPENLDDLPDEARFIRYDFGATFLNLKTIGTSLVFKVGPKELPNFRMIERHYFRNKLLKSFDFTFGFCIPNSTNSWEVIYDMPVLTADLKKDMLEHPYEARSDSFYFVNDELVMHNKAEYAYSS